MFIEFENFDSINTISDLPYGTYATRNEIFFTDKFSASLIFYTHEDHSSPCAADLLCIDSKAGMYFRDFVLLPDNDWRDSYGVRAAKIEDLLPPEILGLTPYDVHTGAVRKELSE